jgi:hypothetical protein
MDRFVFLIIDYKNGSGLDICGDFCQSELGLGLYPEIGGNCDIEFFFDYICWFGIMALWK